LAYHVNVRRPVEQPPVSMRVTMPMAIDIPDNKDIHYEYSYERDEARLEPELHRYSLMLAMQRRGWRGGRMRQDFENTYRKTDRLASSEAMKVGADGARQLELGRCAL
jgi:hypothetical protein